MNDDNVLFNFCAGEFHQDWVLEADDAQGIVQQYIDMVNDADIFRNLAAAIRSFVARPVSDDQLDRSLFEELRCYYVPHLDHKTTRGWLIEVAETVEREAHRLSQE